jgi:hypothetical protein
VRVTVRLNGTEVNPYHKLGLIGNPFPAIPKAEFATANRLLANLASEPITSLEDLETRLEGCSEEFIAGCKERYEPGKMVEFVVEFPNA